MRFYTMVRASDIAALEKKEEMILEETSLSSGDEFSVSSESLDRQPPRAKRSLLLSLTIFSLPFWSILLCPSCFKNEVVTERIMPQIQQQIDKGMSKIDEGFTSFNESFYEYRSRINQSVAMNYISQDRLRPGFQLAQEKQVQGKYPVVMIPGFVTSGLELWEGKECAKKYFRQRMWGGVGSVQSWIMERHCVMEHLALDRITGKDPEGIRIRPAQGFEAADYFMGNFWVWGRILENLADVGYDGSKMTMESYDWRLSFPKLEERDGYFTKLKYKVEAFHRFSGEKVVLTSHSYGSLLVHYFFAWISAEDEDWVDNHIHCYVNIAGAHLGVPKAASALMSGEMSDTIFMGPFGHLVEQFISRKQRRDLWVTWGSLWTMLPKGGNSLWGKLITMTDADEKHLNDAEDNPEPDTIMHQSMKSFASRANSSASHVIDFLSRLGGGFNPETASDRWHDLLKTPLPHAPNMKIYCLYGVGLNTENGYYYKQNSAESENGDPPFIVDTNVEDAENNIIHGVQYTDGDASVPLASLGYMCADAWRRPDSGLNPAKIPIITREYKHNKEVTLDDPLRGRYSGDHCSILGHNDVLGDLIKIVSDHDVEEVQDEIISDILRISEEINEEKHVAKEKKRRKTLKKFRLTVRKLCSSLKKFHYKKFKFLIKEK